MVVSKEIIEQIRLIIPPLNGSLHKGQSGKFLGLNKAQIVILSLGRVAVVGGSLVYVISIKPSNGTE
jgi:hypothetical protein